MKNREEEVYWLSFTDLGENTQITPAERNGILGQEREKKIQLFTSIRDGLGVLSIGRGGMSGKVVSVYKPVIPSPDLLLKPPYLPYENLLAGKEYWCLVPLSASKVCDIKVGKEIDTRSFKYGGRVLKFSAIIPTKFKIYAWDEILPEWDKKGKTMKLKRQKTFSASIPTSKAAEEAYKKWQESKDPKDARKFMDIWTREVYIPARKKGIMVDPDPAIVDAASGHIEHPEWVKKKGQKNFGSTAAKATEDKPVAREAGLIGGSALIGLGAGLGVKGLADNANKVLDRVTYRPIKKTVEENGKKIKKVVELKERAGVAKVTRKLRPGAEKLQKFAQTKGGKAALIGIPTAVIGGVVYKSAKKKNKKKEDK